MKRSVKIVLSIAILMAFIVTSLGLTSIAVNSIKINTTSLKISVGKTYKLKATVIPENATNKKVTFISTNRKIASVDKNGNIKGIIPGKTVITVTSTSNKKAVAKCSVTVVQEKRVLKVLARHFKGDEAKSDVLKALGSKYNFTFKMMAPVGDVKAYLLTLLAANDLPYLIDNYFGEDDTMLSQVYAELSLDTVKQNMPDWWNHVNKISSLPISTVIKMNSTPDGKWRVVFKPYESLMPRVPAWNKTYLDQLGVGIPTTIAEIETVFKKFKDKYPDKYPVTVRGTAPSWAFVFWLYSAGFNPGQWGVYGDQIILNRVAPANRNAMKEVLALLAKAYKNKWINPDWVTMDYPTIVKDFATGNSIFFGEFLAAEDFAYGNKGNIANQLKDATGHEITPGPWPRLNANTPVKPFIWGPLMMGKGSGIGFNRELERDPELFARVLRFENDCVYNEDTWKLIEYGIEGKHYKLDKEGNAVRLPGFQTPEELNAVGIGAGKEFGLISYTYAFRNIYADIPELKTIKNKYWGPGKMFPNSYPNDFSIDKAINGFKDEKGENLGGKYGQDLDAVWYKYFYEIVLGKKPVDAFDEYVDYWYKHGGEELIKVATKNSLSLWK